MYCIFICETTFLRKNDGEIYFWTKKIKKAKQQRCELKIQSFFPPYRMALNSVTFLTTFRLCSFLKFLEVPNFNFLYWLVAEVTTFLELCLYKLFYYFYFCATKKLIWKFSIQICIRNYAMCSVFANFLTLGELLSRRLFGAL